MFRIRDGKAPTGHDGFVPLRALVERLHEKGSPGDAATTDRRVLPRRLGPDQMAGWWRNPSSCDVEGIDTEDSPIYSVPLSISGRKRRALSRIAVIAEKEESDRIRKVLADSFTADELERMAEGPSLIVETEPRLRGCTGYYVRRQDGIPVPRIVLEEGTTPDGIVHEAVHHLRAMDGRTAFPTKGAVLDGRYGRMDKASRDEIFRREESETVAETVARTWPDPVESGYYSSIPGADPRAAYLRDQEIISGSRALKGRAAVRAAQENYARSSISRAIISANRRPRR